MVLGHVGYVVNGFNSLFPVYSFHMVLFMFISGYFYKPKNEENILKYIKNKAKKLLVTYFIWNLVYGIIGMLLRGADIISFGKDITFFNFFIDPRIMGNQYVLNVATWFIPALFLVNICYLLLRKLLVKFKIWNDIIMLIIFMVTSLICGYICHIGVSKYFIPLFRTGFVLFFYHFGYVYKTKFENKINLKSELYFAILIIAEIILVKFGKNINYHMFSMNFIDKNVLCIFLAEITGILFWVKIAEITEPILGKNKLVNIISSNTLDIVIHHMAIVLFFNIILYKINDWVGLLNFNVNAFKKSIYFVYNFNIAQFTAVYVFIAIGGSIAVKCIIDKSKKLFKNKHKKEEIKYLKV